MAEEVIIVNPELGMFIILSDTYGFVDDSANQCRVARRGLAIYTKKTRLKNTLKSCVNN
ncbi:MAG: hypothetical protein ABGY08_04225 [Gammaproteobacteria bacterium]